MAEARVLRALPNSAVSQTSSQSCLAFTQTLFFLKLFQIRKGRLAARPQEGKSSSAVRRGSELHSMLIG
jgi:hypothetical protein